MLDHFQDCLKSIVCVTFIEFCKGDSQMQGMGGGRERKSYHFRIVYIRVALICVRLVLGFSISILPTNLLI